MSEPDLAAVAALRASLWRARLRPVPVYTVEAGRRLGHGKPGKHPAGAGWPLAARRTPPTAAFALPDRDTANTGILCDALRAVDLDIDDATPAQACEAAAHKTLGKAPTRLRSNSPRKLMLYRAAEGAPPKKSLVGTLGKIEVLGKGQQFVAFGDHESGVDLQWDLPLDDGLFENIPVVTEEQVDEFLTRCAEIIGAKPPRQRGNSEHRADSDQQAEPLRVAAALNAIPNDESVDREAWVRIGLAMWGATEGSEFGFTAWNAWSMRHPSYNLEYTRKTWDSFAKKPPTEIGAGTLFYLAEQARIDLASGGSDEDLLDDPPGTAPPEDEPPDDEPPGGGPSSQTKNQGAGPDGYVGLTEYLSVDGWLKRDLPKPDCLLGELLTTTARAFVVGPTGTGKSMLAVASGVAVAAGRDFLHWHCPRPARVLYIDGEMPLELVQTRVAEAIQRFDCDPQTLELFLYSLYDAEIIAKQWPGLGKLEPLNTQAGQRFMLRLCKALRPHLVIFDNVMALMTGDQKDEVPWSETLPLVHQLTRHRIGQLWIDHTGHNTERQYGSSTKAWRFDAVGILTALPFEQRNASELAFTLSFDHPGKARRRTPANWEEFSPHVIRLRGDEWTSEPVHGAPIKTKVQPFAEKFHGALLDTIAAAPTGPGQTAMFAWEAECIRRGLIDPAEPDETQTARHRRKRIWRTARSALLTAGWIIVDGERVYDLTRKYQSC